MKRIDSIGAVGSGLFTEGSPIAGVQATRVSASWLNTIQEEIANVVEEAGITLDQTGANTTQLLEAIQSLLGQSTSVPIGSITAFGGATVPTGWLSCDGSLVTSSQYPQLFAAIGYSWGGGEGSFYLPDLRGRFLRGVDGGAGVDTDASTRTASHAGGNTGNAVGTVQSDQIKAHTHGVTLRLGDNNDDESTPPAASNGSLKAAQYTVTSASTGGTETRPKNAAVYFIIKAE